MPLSYLQLSVEMLRNLSPPPVFVFSLKSTYSASLLSPFLIIHHSEFSRLLLFTPPFLFSYCPFSFLHLFSTLLFLFWCHLYFLPFVILPPCLVVWWPGTGTVQGILSDTTMREHCGTCCNSSNLDSPRNCTISR